MRRKHDHINEVNSANAVRNAQGRRRAPMTAEQQAAHDAANARSRALGMAARERQEARKAEYFAAQQGK